MLADFALGQLVSSANTYRIFASPCFSMSLATVYRPRPHGWQPTVSVGPRTSDRVKASVPLRNKGVLDGANREHEAPRAVRNAGQFLLIVYNPGVDNSDHSEAVPGNGCRP
jgi:hypothetical protein